MRIAYLTAGAGALRCGACAHDFVLISALRQLAHDVRVVPLYTPMHTDLGEMHFATRVHLGGISTYLRAKHPNIGRAMSLLRPILDSRAVLNVATRAMIQTDAHQLGELTRSVLQGTAGVHAAEIARLVATLKDDLKPDVVVLTNTMLSPLATPIRQGLGIAVVSGFLGEDSFVMDLPEPFRTECITLLRAHAASLDRVICPCEAAAGQAGLLLHAADAQIRIVRAAVDARPYSADPRDPGAVATVGYLSVIRPSKGLDLLIRAMHLASDRLNIPMRVLVGGQVVNTQYMKQMRRLAKQSPAHLRFEFLGELELEEKAAMLRQCNLLCLPSRIAETRGLAAMEGMAAGCGLIAPAHGVFPELVRSGGGWLFEPGNVDQLARILVSVLSEPGRGADAGQRAAEHVRASHDPLVVARALEQTLLEATAHPSSISV